ncbi:Telomeric repeat-binding factor 2 [Merluccius polli]|uniref:Telomeric repeat-binding factor n=1 Tax=Merluccius polli TaxID=89951 RepID=A0AA47P9T1_MERPO|nr:Telomeric repeat-binding factor 2 [Merluccius polli]
MAANVIESPTPHQDQELIVNRWLVDYYFSLAVDAIKTDQYADFCDFRDALERVFSRPVECTDVQQLKFVVIRFLSMINDGEKLDFAFDPDHSVTPLEAAVKVLTNLRNTCSISQEEVEKVCTSIKEMLVVICVKNGEFEKAKDILTKHLPGGMVGKKAILMGLANQKVKSHDILEQTNFKKFKVDMVNFSEQLFPSSVPFLYKAAKQLLDKRQARCSNQGGAPGVSSDQGVHPGVSSDQGVHPGGSADQGKRRLMAAYTELSRNSSKTTFIELEEEEQEEEEEEEEDEEEEHDSLAKDHSASGTKVCDAQPGPGQFSQGASSSPREACVACQQNALNAATSPSHSASSQGPAGRQRPGRLYTVAQLVREPDSQVSTQEPDVDVVSLEVEAVSLEVEAVSHAAGGPLSESANKKRPVTLTPKSPEELQSRVPCLSRKKLLDDAKEAKETWSDEDSLFTSSRASSRGKHGHLWSDEESSNLKEAVARFGEGNWAKIMAKYKFKNRTNVNLKDRWRTMKRLKLV